MTIDIAKMLLIFVKKLFSCWMVGLEDIVCNVGMLDVCIVKKKKIVQANCFRRLKNADEKKMA